MVVMEAGRGDRRPRPAGGGGSSIQAPLIGNGGLVSERPAPDSSLSSERRAAAGCYRPALWELPAQAAIGLLLFGLAVGMTFPFFFAMSEGSSPIWDTLFDAMEYYKPLSLAAITALAAVAGAKAHGQKRALASFRLVFWLVHLVNLAPLVYTVPWWWKGSLAKSEFGDLFEGLAYVSGVLCQFDMGAV